MKRMMTRVSAGLIAATLGMAPLAVASAQPQAQAQVQQAAASAQPYYTLDTKIADIFADPNARAVFGEFFRKRGEAAGQPEASAEEQANIAQVIKNFTPRQLATFPQANLDEDGLKTLGEALAKVPAPAPSTTSAPAPAAN